ncbi:HotDog domain-containing protein [Cladochytrium replicatum]|nr:HotDog domain-containing protein [Cladochytrium replicatum]
MDAYGHVNNVMYARYFETGRVAFFDHVLGSSMTPKEYTDFIGANGVGVILQSLNITYRLPVEYPDVLTIGIRVSSSSIQSDRFAQEMVLVSHKLEKIATTGSAVVVSYDYREGKKAALEDRLVNALRSSESMAISIASL